MSSRTGPRGSVGSNGSNGCIAGRLALTDIAAHVQTIKKENRNVKIYDNFHINPHNFILYPDKPNQVQPLAIRQPKSLNDLDKGHAKDGKDIMDEVQSKLATHSLPPKKKFAFPQTANQEVGWFSDEMTQVRPTKILGKKSCPETQYAKEYYAIAKLNPYSKHNKQGGF